MCTESIISCVKLSCCLFPDLHFDFGVVGPLIISTFLQPQSVCLVVKYLKTVLNTVTEEKLLVARSAYICPKVVSSSADVFSFIC